MDKCLKCNSEIKEGVSFCGVCGEPVRTESDLTKTLKSRVPMFLTVCIVYSVFYMFCLYENLTGVTFPVFILGTLIFNIICIKALGMRIKLISWVYFLFMILIGISMFLTDDTVIHIFNYLGIMILLTVSMLTHFYNERKWEVGKYIGSMFRAVFGAIGNIHRPFSDFDEFRKAQNRKVSKKISSLFIGLLIAIPLLIIVIALLASADAVFGNVFYEMFDNSNWIIDVIKIVVFTVVVFLLSYGMIAKLAKKDISEESPDRRKGDSIIAITITGLLSVVYLIFSGIQIVYLFMGRMTLPNDYTYAEYAREGFFQLLFVCIINLLIVLLCTSLFKKNLILQIVLTIMSVCTYVMIASSALRMVMYIRGYDLTILRILVLWTLGVIALLLFGLSMKIYFDKFPLFRFGIIIISLLYIGLAFSKPDYHIAKYNLYNTVGEIDNYYLDSLSDDAAPAYEEYYQDALENGNGDYLALFAIRDYFKNGYKTDYKVTLRNFNISRYTYCEIDEEIKYSKISKLIRESQQ